MALDTTTYEATVERGGFPALGQKVGLVQNFVDLDTITCNDGVSVFKFDSPTLVMNAGVEVVEAATASVTVALGVAEDGNTIMAATDIGSCSIGCLFMGACVPLIIPAAGCLVLSVAGAEPTCGCVRTWALVADIDDLKN